eukprot:7387628-Prymnesium_polylepis.1
MRITAAEPTAVHAKERARTARLLAVAHVEATRVGHAGEEAFLLDKRDVRTLSLAARRRENVAAEQPAPARRGAPCGTKPWLA